MEDLKIKFSQKFSKFGSEVNSKDKVILLEVFEKNINDLSGAFIDYDTVYCVKKIGIFKSFDLSNYENCLILLFYSPEKNFLFTTIRKFSLEKKDFFTKKRGKVFGVEIK